MSDTKPLSFEASAGSYFVLSIVSLICMYVPFLGWAFLLNYTGEWFAQHSMVNGKKVKYQATFGESLGFVAVNLLLLLITLGIYSFWFYPKLYKYVADHASYDTDADSAAKPAAPSSDSVA